MYVSYFFTNEVFMVSIRLKYKPFWFK